MENLIKENENITKMKVLEPYFEIEGGNPLVGEIEIPGAKNSTLPAIVAACLSADEVVLKNVPTDLNDVRLLIDLLVSAGAEIKVDRKNKSLVCSGESWNGGVLAAEMASKIRHSLLLLGLSASWKKELYLPMPGGCDLGSRKHDMHVSALQIIGHTVLDNEGVTIIPGPSNKEIIIDFYYPTFGGTLNAIFASVKLNGSKVIINNAARNPEVLDVIALLNQMGAEINWLDEKTIIIKGVSRLRGTTFSIMPDRIIGATVISAVGITKGNVTLKNFNEKLLKAEIDVWKKSGLSFEQDSVNGLTVKWDKGIIATDIETKAFPGFHTDIQPLHAILMVFAKGDSTIKETILDGRFKYCKELVKMGAEIEVKNSDFYCVNGAVGQIAYISGVDKLHGTEVKATDIRGGAAVAVAALAAEGKTKVRNIYQIERGYDNFIEIFSSLGATIRRVN